MQDLESIVAGEQPAIEEPVSEAPVEEPAVEEAPAEPEAAQEPEPPKEKPEAPMVPLAALQEVRRELQDMKARLPQPEAPKVPDVLDDPQGFASHQQGQVQRAVTGTKLEMSRFMAEREFGVDVVQQAHAYFDAHPEQSGALMDHPSPFHAAVEFFKSQQVAEEIGKDPAGYKAKLEAEIRAKVEAEQVTKQARDKAGQFAPSMADVTGTGGGPKTQWAGPTPLDQLIG